MLFFKNIIRQTTSRLILGAFLIVLAFVIALWDYATQELTSWDFSSSTETETTTEETESPSLPEAPEFIDETLDIYAGDNFSSVLSRAGVSKDQTTAIVEALGKVFGARDLRTDHKLFITYRPATASYPYKDITLLVIKVSLEKEAIVEQDADGAFQARIETKELVQETRRVEGVIENSLYVDAIKNGAHPKVLHSMIQAFSYDVDFQRAFQPGDRYALLFDLQKDPETLQEKPGELIYASLTLQGKTLHIYRFHTPNGGTQYYTEKGEAVKKGLLKTPIDGARISSGFGSRKHPILGYNKMHKGVDFAAPKGTPIMASGSGKIAKIGPWSTYGNYIQIKHNDKYATAYAHLSRYAKGLRVGSSVRQGQVIGYVGATGRAQGAHLHYEILVNGQQVNPTSVKMMPAGRLSGKELGAFMAKKKEIESRFLNASKPAAEDASATGASTPPADPALVDNEEAAEKMVKEEAQAQAQTPTVAPTAAPTAATAAAAGAGALTTRALTNPTTTKTTEKKTPPKKKSKKRRKKKTARPSA